MNSRNPFAQEGVHRCNFPDFEAAFEKGVPREVEDIMDSSLESDPDHSIDWSIDQMAVLFPAAIEPEEEIDLEEETPKTKRRRLDWEHVEKIEAERYFDKPAAFLGSPDISPILNPDSLLRSSAGSFAHVGSITKSPSLEQLRLILANQQATFSSPEFSSIAWQRSSPPTSARKAQKRKLASTTPNRFLASPRSQLAQMTSHMALKSPLPVRVPLATVDVNTAFSGQQSTPTTPFGKSQSEPRAKRVKRTPSKKDEFHTPQRPNLGESFDHDQDDEDDDDVNLEGHRHGDNNEEDSGDLVLLDSPSFPLSPLKSPTSRPFMSISALALSPILPSSPRMAKRFD